MASEKPRLFEFSDGKSDKFWSISLDGTSHTVTYGRVGTDGQTKTKDFASDEEAKKSYEKLIQQKTKKGYTEAAVAAESRSVKAKEAKKTSAAASAAQKPFLEAILADPDEISNYQVFSDWLTETGDPRGELMAIQLQLEDSNLPKDARKKLVSQEKKLLKQHAADLMGHELATYFIDGKAPANEDFEGGYAYSFARGFLDSVTFNLVDEEFAKTIARSDVRLLRRISINDIDYDDDDGELFEVLAKGKYDNCRSLNVGDYYPGSAQNVEKLIKKMPQIEEIALNSNAHDGNAIFKLKMPHLKSISMEAGYDYPIELLAKNKSLTKFESLSIFPHMLEPGDAEPYVSLSSFKKFCKTQTLTSLQSITIRCHEFGDEGIDALINAPFFSQLTTLNLANGTITEAGAMKLADQDLSKFAMIDVSANYISKAGVQALKSACKKVQATSQFEGEVDLDERQHLWEGSME